jgi:hypothetical protein
MTIITFFFFFFFFFYHAALYEISLHILYCLFGNLVWETKRSDTDFLTRPPHAWSSGPARTVHTRTIAIRCSSTIDSVLYAVRVQGWSSGQPFTRVAGPLSNPVPRNTFLTRGKGARELLPAVTPGASGSERCSLVLSTRTIREGRAAKG